MKLKSSQTLLAIIISIQSAALSSADKMVLNVLTDSAEHQSLSQAVTEIIRSLEGDTPSATTVIKVTSHDADAKYIDPFTETIVRSINGLFEFHIRVSDGGKATIVKQTSHNALLIVSQAMTTRRMVKFLWSWRFESSRKILIVCLASTFSPLEMELMLNIMWRKFALNVHVVSLEANGDVALRTYFPFVKDCCGQVHPVLWNIYRNATFVLQREHFPRKNVNFHRCALSVAVFHAPPFFMLNESGTIDADGVDGKVLKTLASELNFSINYVVVSQDVRWGELYANQSATGATEMVRLIAIEKGSTAWHHVQQRVGFDVDCS